MNSKQFLKDIQKGMDLINKQQQIFETGEAYLKLIKQKFKIVPKNWMIIFPNSCKHTPPKIFKDRIKFHDLNDTAVYILNSKLPSLNFELELPKFERNKLI